MKTNGNDKTLESYKIFPLIAWGLTISFAFFVYNITMDLQETAERLEQRTLMLQQKIHETDTGTKNQSDQDSEVD